MMRVCHLDTCPVGVATQNPRLRQNFSGKAEHVVTFFEYVAEEVRELPGRLGFRTLEEAIGHAEVLDIGRPSTTGRPRVSTSPRCCTCRTCPVGTRAEPHDRAGPRPAARARQHAAAAVRGGAGRRHARAARAAGAQRQPHRRHDARRRADPPARRPRAAGRHHRPDLPRQRRAVVRGVPAARASPCDWRATPTTTSARGCPAARSSCGRPGRRGSSIPTTFSRATSWRTARPAAPCWCAASWVSGSACATPAPPRWSRASATTRWST